VNAGASAQRIRDAHAMLHRRDADRNERKRVGWRGGNVL
jgi:hypothetical protein